MARYTQLIQHLNTLYKPLLSKFEPTTAIELLDAIDERMSYDFVSNEIKSMWKKIADEFDSDGFGAFQKTVMLHLMNDFEKRLQTTRYVDDVLKYFERSFARIEAQICNPDNKDYDSVNDLFLKDLALCRQKLFPAGAQLVQSHTGFHRALMFRGGIKQFWHFVKLLQQTGGHTGYYQYHTHLSELEDFNPDGFDRFYLTGAEMLRVNPTVKGLWTGTWFLDPVLKDISPHLAYIRERPESNGASFFFSEISIDTGA